MALSFILMASSSISVSLCPLLLSMNDLPVNQPRRISESTPTLSNYEWHSVGVAMSENSYSSRPVILYGCHEKTL